jgi:hypothetical protein
MIHKIADVLKESLEGLSWAQVHGLVRPMIRNSDGKKEMLPAACNSGDDCDPVGDLKYIYPDSTQSAVIWIEDRGTTIDFDVTKLPPHLSLMNLQSDLRVMVWLNAKKFDIQYCDLTTVVFQQVTSLIVQNPSSTPENVRTLRFHFKGMPEKSPALFARWSFRDTITAPEYDYLAIDVSAKYSVSLNCTDELELKTTPC